MNSYICLESRRRCKTARREGGREATSPGFGLNLKKEKTDAGENSKLGLTLGWWMVGLFEGPSSRPCSPSSATAFANFQTVLSLCVMIRTASRGKS